MNPQVRSNLFLFSLYLIDSIKIKNNTPRFITRAIIVKAYPSISISVVKPNANTKNRNVPIKKEMIAVFLPSFMYESDVIV